VHMCRSVYVECIVCDSAMGVCVSINVRITHHPMDELILPLSFLGVSP